jgi:hypothetical protein
MASSIQLLRSNNPNERPFPGNLLDGQPAINTNAEEPGLFFKATDGSIVKIGPAAITFDGNPPNTGGTGQPGNTIGELWLDKSLPIPVLKVYDGVQWVDAGSGSGGSPGVVTLQRWAKTASGGETSVSGPDNSSQILSYTPGLEEVFLNGVLLTRGVDYTADSGISITSLVPLTAGDEVTVLGWTPFNILGSIDGSNLVDGTVLASKLSADAVVNSNVASNAAISSQKLQFISNGSGAVFRTVQDKMREVVSVKDFGAVGNGVADDTTAIQNAINFAKSNSAAFFGSDGGGYRTVFFPSGFYKITNTLNITNAVGISFEGEGWQSSFIHLEATNKTLVNLNLYLRVAFFKLAFHTGTITFSGGKPRSSFDAVGSRTNRAFEYRSVGGGTDLVFRECKFSGFDRVFDSTFSTINGDFHTHWNCVFTRNNDVWFNSNNQAVIWSFYQCKMHFNERCFYNAGGRLLVQGGDFINPGTFYESTGTNSLGGFAKFDKVKFENFQNIDPTAAPKWLVISGSNPDIIFTDCSTKTGSFTLSGKTSSVLSGLFSVQFIRSEFDGTFEVGANASVNGVTSYLEFDNCPIRPLVNTTAVSGQGNRPINLVVKNRGLNLRFGGQLSTATIASEEATSTAGIYFSPIINNNSSGKNVLALPPAPYTWTVSNVKFTISPQTSNAFAVTLWTDSSKTTKITETLISGIAPNATRVFDIRPVDFNTNGVVYSSTSNPPYIEISSAATMGEVRLHLQLEFMQTR